MLLRSKLPPKGDEYAYHWKRDYLGKIAPVLVEDYNYVFNMRNELTHNTSIEKSQNEFDEAFLRFDNLIRSLNDI